MRLLPILLVLFLAAFPVAAPAQSVGTVNFDFDSDVLDAEALAKVEQIAANLAANPSYKPTVVIGHTDAVGSYGYNQDLGMRRARAVAAALVSAGAPVARIGTLESRGKNELLVHVSGPERRNRRVTVTLDEILDACRSWREVGLTQASVGLSLQTDLEARLQEAASWYSSLASSGANGPAFQMAGAAREDCASAAALAEGSVRKVEYAQRCLCSSARLRVAAGID